MSSLLLIGRAAPGQRYHVLAVGGHAICSILVQVQTVGRAPYGVQLNPHATTFWGEPKDVTCRTCLRYLGPPVKALWDLAKPDGDES